MFPHFLDGNMELNGLKVVWLERSRLEDDEFAELFWRQKVQSPHPIGWYISQICQEQQPTTVQDAFQKSSVEIRENCRPVGRKG